ncbi:MAG: acyl-ACP--UDP-N-acetylglucosamine O-acyltransferase [Acetobacteraceae bacterium]|nr:acyl-ACP--UDP-N-acetylglucosamine O-acyltransferase [Acetobacteraceae bacterium]MBV8521402.1 acyl-ACP--UDP-N-acetylglucosamine O-acyltransferase [Acetobacteraceae bacterium]MBV8591771.1 acyl-ACP--UDP-N-acetylglucosamine O-acyltransferase [Acetobacteraceae bacterium]
MADARVLDPYATTIHPAAVIARGAEIGRGVRIGPFCTIGPDAVIEDGAELVSHVVVEGHTRIGPDVKLYPFCTIGLPPQDMKYRNEPTRCEIGPGTHVREHSSIHRGTPQGRGITTIGAHCMLMAVTHVAHDCTLGDGVVVANNVVMGGHVTIGDNAVIGGGAAIHQHVTIGRGAMIGGMVGVPGDVVPFGMVSAQRAGWVAGLNVVGLRRRGYDRKQIQTLRSAFRMLFRREGALADRIAQTRRALGSDPLVSEVLAFIDSQGPRGLTPAHLMPDVTDAAA